MKKWLPWVGLVLVLCLSACHRQQLHTVTMTPEQVKALYAEGGTTALGKANAPITMVEIFSYDCRYCRQDYPLIEQFAKEHPNVRIVFKPFMAFGERTKLLPQYAALAAGRQGAFLLMHHALMTTNRPLQMKTINNIAKAINLNMDKFHSDLNDPLLQQEIKNNTKLMDALEIDGIPTVMITQTRLVQNPQLVDQIPQYEQVGFLSNDLLVRMVAQVQKDELRGK